jgi:hypothetical protein
MTNDFERCPLRKTEKRIKESDDWVLINAVFQSCYKEECAWWNKDKKKCSIEVISRAIEGIAYNL